MHGKICPCSNCSGGGAGWLARLAAFLGSAFMAAVVIGGTAAAVESFVHRLVTDALEWLMVASMAAVAAYIVIARVKDHRRRVNTTAPVPVDTPRPAAAVAASEPVDELAARRARRSA